MRVCVYLQVILRVPVRVKDDAGIGSSEVNAQASCSRAQQEDKAVRVGLTETVYRSLAKVSAYAPVDPLVEVSKRTQGQKTRGFLI